MKVKKILALLLVLALSFALFAACSTSGDKPADTDKKDDKPTDPDKDGDDEEELTDIIFYWTQGTNQTKSDEIVDAVNAIIEPKLNIHLDIEWIQGSDYATQLNLAIANREQVDIAFYQFFGATGFTACYSNGLMMPINDLLEDYGKDLVDLIGTELFKAVAVNGDIYGVPFYRILNSDFYWCARKDVFEQAGTFERAKAMTTWGEFESVMADTYKATGTYPLCAYKNTICGDPGGILSTDKFADNYVFDTLGDSYYVIFSDEEGHVSNVWENEDFIEECKMVRRWMDAGWYYPDSPYMTDSSETLVLQGTIASLMVQSEYGVEVAKTQNFGTEAFAVELMPGLITSYCTKKLGAFIPVSAKEPEAAMRFLNEVWQNAELMNIMTWGLEGDTYELVDGEACYPEGKDSSNCGYHKSDFGWGNQFLVLPWKNQGADFRTRALEYFQQAPVSKYMGVAVDTSEYGNLVTAIAAVFDEYAGQLNGGLYSDELYQEMMEKFEAADVASYIKIYQDAVSAYMG